MTMPVSGDVGWGEGVNLEAPEIVTAGPGSQVAEQQEQSGEEYTPSIPREAVVKERDNKGNPTVYAIPGTNKEYYAKGSTPHEAGFWTSAEWDSRAGPLGPHQLGDYYGPEGKGYDLSQRYKYVTPAGRVSEKELSKSDVLKGYLKRGQVFISETDPVGKPHTFRVDESGSSPEYEKYKEWEASVDWQSAKRGKEWVKATEGVSQYFTDDGTRFNLMQAIRDQVPYEKIAKLYHFDPEQFKKTKEEVEALDVFQKNNIQLSTGEWISKKDFETSKDKPRDPKEKEYLMRFGVENFNKFYPILPYKPPSEPYKPSVSEKVKSVDPRKSVPALVSAGLIVTATPVPLDDVVFWLAVAGTAIFSARAIGELAKNRKKVDPESVAMVDMTAIPKGGIRILDTPMFNPKAAEAVLIPPVVRPLREEITMVYQGGRYSPIIPPARTSPGGTQVIPPERTAPKANITKAVIVGDVPKKAKTLEFIKKAKDASASGEALPLELRRVDWDRLLENVHREKSWRKIVDQMAADVNVSEEVKHRYRSAYEEHLRKQAQLAMAWRSYVASINPAPIAGGKPSADAVNAYAIYMAYQSLAAKQKKGVLHTIHKAQAEGKTAVQTQTLARTQISSLTQSLAKTLSLTSAQTEALEQSLTRSLTASRTRAATAAHVATRSAASTLTKAKVKAISGGGIPQIPKIKLPKAKERPVQPKDVGAIALRQGELNNQGVNWLIRKPYKQENVSLHLGNLPPGVTSMPTGKDSAKKSIRLVTGNPPKRLTMDIGAQDAVVTSRGNKLRIAYKPDPRQQTTSQIRLGRRRQNPFASRRRGKLYYTPSPGGTLVSRRPLGRRRRRR